LEQPESIALLCTNVGGDHSMKVISPRRAPIDELIGRRFISLVLNRESLREHHSHDVVILVVVDL
jgi:hypothetical protein